MKKFLVLILFSGLLISCSDSTGPQAENLQLSISPSEQTVAVDEEGTYSVLIENVENVFAISTEITFDDTIVEAVDDGFSVGDFWNSEPVVSLNINDEDRINVTIGLEQSSGVDAITGDGTLFSFSLKGINSGESDLSFVNVQLINDSGETIQDFENITYNNGKIIVN